MLVYIIWDIHPDLITIDFLGKTFPIHWYSLLFAFSFLVGKSLITFIFQNEKVDTAKADSLLVYVAVATVIGARLGHYLFYEWELLFSQPKEWLLSLISLPFFGLASHGAITVSYTHLDVYKRQGL